MSRNRSTYRRNSPEAAARVIAALIAHDGRLDWRELEFLDGVGTLQILGIGRALHGGALALPWRAPPRHGGRQASARLCAARGSDGT